MNKIVGTVLVALLALGSSSFAQNSLVGDWVHMPNIDLITDEDKSALIAQATTFPTYADGSALLIRCSDYARYGVEIFFATDKYLGSSEAYDVVYRIDGGTPQRGRWSASTNNEAVFAPNLGISGVVNAMLDGQELIFRVTSFSQDYTYVVPISGLREAIQKLGCYTGTV